MEELFGGLVEESGIYMIFIYGNMLMGLVCSKFVMVVDDYKIFYYVL